MTAEIKDSVLPDLAGLVGEALVNDKVEKVQPQDLKVSDPD